jgi:E3 ubiquitin-protein ligase TRIP12
MLTIISDSAGPSNEPHTTSTSSTKRKTSRSKKGGQGVSYLPSSDSSHRWLTFLKADTSGTTPNSGRRSKKITSNNKDADTPMDNGVDDKPPPVDDDDASDDNEDDEVPQNYEGREDDDDPFGGFGGPGGPPHGLSSTLRALSGMMSGVSTRLRDILNNLKQKDDPSVQLIALQELSEILLVSTEDNLSGHFSPDAFVKELVVLMQPSDFGEENPEMMLLACRCLANLMEALPASTANVVYGGAVPVLCAKLLEIHFIDLAEQALSVRIPGPKSSFHTNFLSDTREDLG